MYSNFQNIHDTTITLLNFFLKLTVRDTITLYLLIYSNSFLFCEVGRHYSLQQLFNGWRLCLSTSQKRVLKFISIKIYSIINMQRWKHKQLWQIIIKRSLNDHGPGLKCDHRTMLGLDIYLEFWVLPWNRIFTKSSGCRSRVDAAPPLTPATRCSHFKWRNIPLTGGVTLASFTCDLLMARLSGVLLSLHMNILNNT